MVLFEGFVRCTRENKSAVIEQDDAIAETLDGLGVMRDKDNDLALGAKYSHPLDALFLKSLVADGEDLIDYKHVGIQVYGQRESQPRLHPGRIVLDWYIHKGVQFGK